MEKVWNASNDRFEKLATRMDQLVTSHKNLEMQISQMASSSSSRPQGSWPSQPEVNPKEHCKAITLRSGKQLVETTSKKKQEEDAGEKKNEEEVLEKQTEEKAPPNSNEKGEDIFPPYKEDYTPPPGYVPPVPFPQRLKQQKLDKQ